MEKAIKLKIKWNDLKQKIIDEFKEQQTDGWDSEGKPFIRENEWTPLISYKNLENELKVDKSILQVEVREMRNAGLLELCPAVDYEYYNPSGSGWQITKRGLDFLNHIAEGKDAESFFRELTEEKI